MSLINDALKRVGQKRSVPRPGDGSPLQPADHSGSNGSSSPGLLVVVLIVAVLGAGGWFGWNYYKKKSAPTPAGTTAKGTGTNKAPIVAKGTNAPSKGATNAVASKPGATQQMASAKPSAPTAPEIKPAAKPQTPAATPAANLTPSVAATAPSSEKGSFPALKLQGIFYRLSKPSAVINGTTVFVGDTVKDTQVKVAAIERTNVTVELEGQKLVLSMK